MSASLEEYLRSIYILIAKHTYARVTDIAEELGYSKPSVNRALKVLKQDGYITYENYGDITLTVNGNKLAEDIVKRYNILKAFLVEVLEIDTDTAEIEARNMKHSISSDTISKLEKYIKTIIDVENLKCDYNPHSSKCRTCLKATAKFRLKK